MGVSEAIRTNKHAFLAHSVVSSVFKTCHLVVELSYEAQEQYKRLHYLWENSIFELHLKKRRENH